MRAPSAPSRLASWVFDALPPSQARRGGDPAEHAFRPELDTFVREVVQNANDQRVGNPEVRFMLKELSGAALQSFFEALDWRALRGHLEHAAAQRGGRALGQFLRDLEVHERLLLLLVEDRETVGLTGHETEGDSHFRALCKDTLYSHKQLEGAGGSYGLGKSVLWAFSGASTVLFSSVLRELPEGGMNPRFIGRAELPSHPVGKQWYSGSGWLGQERALEGGARRAESLWGPKAARASDELALERAGETGTSILIVGFREPASDAEASVPELERRIREAAARHFWPAMHIPGRELSVFVGGQRVVPEHASRDLEAFVSCYAARSKPSRVLEAPGDVLVRPLTLDIPPLRDGGAAVKGRVDLIVRLAPEDTASERVGHVALFRGPGMVVQYWNLSALASTVRPFHAVLACGEARAPGEVTPEDVAVERFLRAAEPPGHDEWGSSAALKASYARGYAKALEQLKDSVRRELRQLLGRVASEGRRGPERLQRRFPIGKQGGEGSAPRAFQFQELQARVEDGRWVFSGRIAPAARQRPWQATVRLREVGDDGAPLGDVAITEFGVDNLLASSRLEAGVAHIEAAPAVSQLAFSGRSAPISGADGMESELSLELDGTLLARSG